MTIIIIIFFLNKIQTKCVQKSATLLIVTPLSPWSFDCRSPKMRMGFNSINIISVAAHISLFGDASGKKSVIHVVKWLRSDEFAENSGASSYDTLSMGPARPPRYLFALS